MKAGRRAFLKTALVASSLAALRDLLSLALPQAHAREIDRSLVACLDTLLPAGPGPGAIDLGVDRAIVAAAQSEADYARFLAQGVKWLNAQARALGANDFSSLPEAGRERIVARAAAAPRDAVERRFFEQLRADAFTVFYTDARSWQALNYHGPPQPRGFPDHAGPPDGAAR